MIPDDSDLLAQWVARAYADAEVEIIRRLAQRLQVGIGSPAWELETLTRLRSLSTEALGVLQSLDREVWAVLDEAISQAYVDAGISQAEIQAATAKVAATEIASNNMRRSVAAIATDLRTPLDGVRETMLRAVPDVYRSIVGETVSLATARGLSKRDALKRATRQFLKDGISDMRDTAGRRWNIQDYTNMAVRTGMNRAADEGHLESIRAVGLDLVTIQPGPRACKVCDEWARKILSLDGRTGKIETEDRMTGKTITVRVDATLSQARAAGYKHPNCRCSTKAYIPGLTDPSTLKRPPWDEAGYEAQQEQRALEKQIREAKLAQAAGDPDAAARVKAGQAKLREHLAANPALKRRSDREQIITGGDPDVVVKAKNPPAPKPEKPKFIQREEGLQARLRETIADSRKADDGMAEVLEDMLRASEEKVAKYYQGGSYGQKILALGDPLPDAVPFSKVRAGTNPRGPQFQGAYIEGAAENCTRVSAAVELRRRGFKVTAAEIRKTDTDRTLSDILNKWTDRNGQTPDATLVDGRDELLGGILGGGDGSRWFIQAPWKRGGAHVWNAEVIDGRVVFQEAQGDVGQGGSLTQSYLEQIEWRSKAPSGKEVPNVRILRVDDLFPQDRLLDDGWIIPQ